MELTGIPIGKKSQRDIARKRYNQWSNRSKESKIYRAVLFALCGGKCPTCDVDMILRFGYYEKHLDNEATLDHIIPLSKVLEHNKFGLIIMCKKCNNEKGSNSLEI